MPIRHKIQEGDCINSIASRYGFFPETIWKDSQNAGLRQRSGKLNTLTVGDVVVVPDKRLQEQECASDARHRFKRKGVPAKLCLQILHEGKPVGNKPYLLTIDGKLLKGSTDANGYIDVAIPPEAAEADLQVKDGDRSLEYFFSLGGLAPISTLKGIQQRLNNLGFECDDESEVLDESTKQALLSFQAKHQLPVTGNLDESVRAKIEQVHDNK
jgi:hypothetical protein